MSQMYNVVLLTVILNMWLSLQLVYAKKFEKDKPDWAKKDIRDYSEVDLERLLDQWEEDEEPLPDDELPEHLRPRPKISFDPSNIGDPEQLIKMSKKGQTIMMFVRVRDIYSIEEANKITQRWQSSLWNNHVQAERYPLEDRRAIFMLKDGSYAWDAKDFLIDQEELQEVTLENRPYYGKLTPEFQKEKAKEKQEKKSKSEL